MSAQDRLEEVPAKIVVLVQPDAARRDDRTVMVSVGIGGELPVSVKGKFGRLGELIAQAWANQGQVSTGTPSPSLPSDEGVVLSTAEAAYGDDDIW